MLVQDRVLAGAHADPDYVARRAGAFFFVVELRRAGGHVLLRIDGDGPRAESDFDLAATEVATEASPNRRTSSSSKPASAAGAALLARLGLPSATDEEVRAARAVTERAASRMARTLDAATAREALAARPDHPRFADVAERCLGCANCTMACPTCFCATIEDTTDLSGEVATRDRLWDSCFDVEYAYIHGGSVPAITRGALPPVDRPRASRRGTSSSAPRDVLVATLHHVVSSRNRHHGEARAVAATR